MQEAAKVSTIETETPMQIDKSNIQVAQITAHSRITEETKNTESEA